MKTLSNGVNRIYKFVATLKYLNENLNKFELKSKMKKKKPKQTNRINTKTNEKLYYKL